MTDTIAAEAASLRDNEAFQKALDNLRNGALEALVRVPATDVEAIRDYQATVKVVDELRNDIEGFIASGRARARPGIA
jgi:hypothetical protein